MGHFARTGDLLGNISAGIYGWALPAPLVSCWPRWWSQLLYVTFIFSFTELTIPPSLNAGGPFSTPGKALGPTGGLIAGYATFVEFLLATPAIMRLH